MYYFKKNRKPHLDLRGNLILSHNTALVKAQVKGAAPRYVHNAQSAVDISRMSFWRKLKVWFAAGAFIFGPNLELTNGQIGHIDVDRKLEAAD